MVQKKSVMSRVNMDFPSEHLSGNNWKISQKIVMSRVNMDFPSEHLSGNNWKIPQKSVYRDLFA
jgi:hypothetical protein